MNTGGKNRPERRLAAILAADVAGYSRLIGVDEEGTLHRLKSIRAEVIDPVIAASRGRLVKTTGDGFLVEFTSVVDALRCAVDVQREIADRGGETRADRRLELRIGVHQGDIVVEDGDIFGDGVNVAARLEALAEPGAICVSARVQEDAAGRLDLAFADMGEQTLKNIARPIRVYRVGPHKASPPPVQAPLPLPDKPSIAVLPFQNMSADPEQEVFADGMVEDITTALSKLRWFFVIARNSSFAYKGRAVDVKQVGRELGVRYVLEGSVRKGGNRLRITAQLVEAESGNHVWAERYDRDIGDIFTVQDEITERVVAAIEPELYAAENIRSQRKPPESLDAWECVIRALSAVSRGTREAHNEAEQMCRQAISVAPGYGQAHSLLAWVLVRRAFYSGGELGTLIAEISSEARAALSIDERDPWAHLVQGSLYHRLRRFDDAVRAKRRALELNPNFALAHAQLATSLANLGKHQEATHAAQHALRLSRNDRSVRASALTALMIVDFAAKRYAECIMVARTMIENNPEHSAGHLYLAAALAMQDELTAAAEALAALLRLRPELSLAWMRQNLPPAGDLGERLRDGLRKAGVPEA
jgi:TolB-like protein/class 3 adenylate cyclase/cytochrome c-type biogenesis protein CcmH/NrfG